MNTEDTPAAKRIKTNIARYGENVFSQRASRTTAAWEQNGKKPRGFAYLKAHGLIDQLHATAKKGGKARQQK